MKDPKLVTVFSILFLIMSIPLSINMIEVEGADGSFGGGSGTPTDPYIIEDVLDLQNISNYLSAHFILTKDINATITKTWNHDNGFLPIGNGGNPFTGSLEGRGFAIEDLFINLTWWHTVGLFSYNKGLIKNVSLVGGRVEGYSRIGGLVGWNSGTVENCSISGSVIGVGEKIGGLIGHLDNGFISNCRSNALVSSEGDGVGGLVGFNNNGFISNCRSNALVSSKGDGVGGLVGFNHNGLISKCGSDSDVSGAINIGGLLGENKGSIDECYSNGNVTGEGNIGGLTGINKGNIVDCLSMGNVTGTLGHIGGLVGWNLGVLNNSHYNYDDVLINGNNFLTLGVLYEDQYNDWIKNGQKLRISDYQDVIVPNGYYFEIGSVQGLQDILGFVDIESYRYRLVKDLDLSLNEGLYIPYFGGKEFDGNNHTISNLTLDLPFTLYLGMFGYIDKGALRNIILTDIDIVGDQTVGGLVGTNNFGLISNCFVEGRVNGSEYGIGGLAGDNLRGTISDCVGKVNVSGEMEVGGLIGCNSGTVLGCCALGDVESAHFAGGLIGYNENGPVLDSYAEGNVTGTKGVGGLMGNLWGGSISRCFALGNVIGTENVGGLVGDYYLGTISNCYSLGDVVGVENVGGLIGTSNDFGEVSFCYSTGMALGNISVGGVIGFNKGNNILLCFWDIVTSGIKNGIGNGTTVSVFGRTTEEMMDLNTFYNSRWDICHVRNLSSGVWYIDDGYDYPHLKWESYQDIRPPVANAGPDQWIDLGDEVLLDGSGSFDNIGVLDYEWTIQDHGIIEINGISPRFNFTVSGVFIVTLNVTDGEGNWDTDSLNVTVTDVTAPIADAGQDQTVDVGSRVRFDGSGSSDDERIGNFFWTFADEGSVSLYGIRPRYVFYNPGAYIVTLNVTDGSGNWDTDTMTVKVNELVPPVAKLNLKDTFHYLQGLKRSIVRAHENITLSAEGSFDPVGEIVDYHWEIPAKIILINGSLTGDKEASETIKFQFVGNSIHYDNITLWVGDSSGLFSTKDWINLMHDSAPPTLDTYTIFDTSSKTFLKAPFTIDEDVELEFNASRAEDNGVIVDHIWSFSDGSGTFNGISMKHTFEDPGKFKISLILIDAVGNTLRLENRTIIVRDTTKPIPVITLSTLEIEMGTEVKLDGSRSYDPRTFGDLYFAISNYTWFLHKVGENYTKHVVLGHGKVIDNTFMVPGYWVLNLTIIDENGLIAWTEMTLLVGGPDLQVEGVVFVDPEIRNIKKGGRCKISLMIKNYGNVDIPDGMEWELKIDLDGKTIKRDSVDSAIRAGGSIYFNFSYTFETEGTNELMVYLDNTDTVPEIVETNNEFKVSFNVRKQPGGPDWGMIIPFVVLFFVVLPITLFLLLGKKKGPGHDLKLEE